MSEELKAKIDSLKKKNLLTKKDKLKTPRNSQIRKRLKKAKESDLNTLPRGLKIDTTTGFGKNIIAIPKNPNDMIVLPENMAKGGRVGLKSGSKGCKLAMKGKGRAYGKNS